VKRNRLLPILLLMLTSLALGQSALSGQQSSSGAQAGTPPAPGVRAGQLILRSPLSAPYDGSVEGNKKL
jgi:hypothetical protein